MEDAASTSISASTPSPSFECQLCELQFDTAEDKRQHAKSEWHVYKIRCRVAEPGTIIPPPGSKPQSSRGEEDWTTSKNLQSDEEDYSEDSEEDIGSEKELIEFTPEECLFCNKSSKDFGENLSHMQQTHSLVIPYQSSLEVDLQTLMRFLHMVIFSYRECIGCGKHRRTTEAVQQHMTSTGHCRFNMTEEIREFYNIESLDQQATAEGQIGSEDHTRRLPSGKLIGNRSYIDPTPKTRLREKSPTGPAALPAPEQNHPQESQALTRREKRAQARANQIAQLRTGDQMSLVHLPESQQRSLLVTQKKKLDEAKRTETREQKKMDNVGNKTAIHTKYYKQEVPVYQGG